jgi:hypothetical protein
MASIIRVKRSTGTTAPATLNYGELGLTIGVGTHGNRGGRLYAGDNSQNPQLIGGRYYTDLLSIAPGLVAGQDNPTTPANGFVPVLLTENGGNPGGLGAISRLPRVDQWSVDNLTFDGNTISSNDTDGDIELRTNGAGEVVIPDDQFLTFGDSKDAKIEYDENGSDAVQVTGAPWVWNTNQTYNLPAGSQFVIDNVGISSNVISTRPGGGNELYIDPYPDGFSNEGTVIIKGDLQVDGTTTTVNSSAVTVNESIFNLGDVTSARTVMTTVIVGVSTVRLDSVVGINTGDTLAVSGIGPSGIATVSAIDISNKVVTFDTTATSGINTTTQVTVTHGFDTNTDRGISFDYNISSGTSNNKTGFFGLDDSSIANSSAGALNHGTHADDSRRWTYVPDAAINNSVVTGTKGFLDIKGIYYQSGDYDTNGIVYFDSTGLQRSTNDPDDSDTTVTSTQILTAVTEIVLTLSGNASLSAGAQITQQNNSAAYGMVKTTTSSSNTVTLIGVQGTFDTTNDIVADGSSVNENPTNVTTTYTSKPTWTSTIDGGTF